RRVLESFPSRRSSDHVVAAQVEDGLPPAHTQRARGEFGLGEEEPLVALPRVLVTLEQRGHVEAVEDDGLALTVVFGQFNTRDRGDRKSTRLNSSHVKI